MAVQRSPAAIRGSPPRVWGNRRTPAPRILAPRFTPTCVGKSLAGKVSAGDVTVHPHVCGEIAPLPGPFCAACGSPPRVWGNQGDAVANEWRNRFTPTCVGKSSRRRCYRSSAPVHPHVCGEIGYVHPHGHGDLGSPPRVWGNQRCPKCITGRYRFTPTCVGKSTRHQRHRARVMRFTPTCVGKSVAQWGSTVADDGSPPRVWGNRRNSRHHR